MAGLFHALTSSVTALKATVISIALVQHRKKIKGRLRAVPEDRLRLLFIQDSKFTKVSPSFDSHTSLLSLSAELKEPSEGILTSPTYALSPGPIRAYMIGLVLFQILSEINNIVTIQN